MHRTHGWTNTFTDKSLDPEQFLVAYHMLTQGIFFLQQSLKSLLNNIIQRYSPADKVFKTRNFARCNSSDDIRMIVFVAYRACMNALEENRCIYKRI